MKGGIVRYVVGFSVGKFGLPDKGLINGISSLPPNCRECRVSLAGETARENSNRPLGESSGFDHNGSARKKRRCVLTGVDLNDARNRR